MDRGAAPDPGIFLARGKRGPLEIGSFAGGVKVAGDQGRPVGLSGLVGDEIISNFDQGVWFLSAQRVLVDGVSGQVASVGLVIADGGGELLV